MKNNNRKGFTLTELVIVIAVIAILAGVLIPTFTGIVQKANKNAAPAPVPAATPAPVAAPVEETDDLELIAVITAAIHAYEEAQGNVVEGDLIVRSIKKRNNRWQNA